MAWYKAYLVNEQKKVIIGKASNTEKEAIDSLVEVYDEKYEGGVNNG